MDEGGDERRNEAEPQAMVLRNEDSRIRELIHKLNNALTPIVGFAELVKEALPDDSPAQADVALLLEATREAANITAELLALARRPWAAATTPPARGPAAAVR